MLKHIVFFKLKNEYSISEKTEKVLLIKQKLDQLPAIIQEIEYFEVGIDNNKSERAFDASLISVFKSKTELEKYQMHPKHLEVLAFIKEVCERTAVVDYDF